MKYKRNKTIKSSSSKEDDVATIMMMSLSFTLDAAVINDCFPRFREKGNQVSE